MSIFLFLVSWLRIWACTCFLSWVIQLEYIRKILFNSGYNFLLLIHQIWIIVMILNNKIINHRLPSSRYNFQAIAEFTSKDPAMQIIFSSTSPPSFLIFHPCSSGFSPSGLSGCAACPRERGRAILDVVWPKSLHYWYSMGILVLRLPFPCTFS